MLFDCSYDRVLFPLGSSKPKKPYDHSWIASDSVPDGERLARSATPNVFVTLSNVYDHTSE